MRKFYPSVDHDVLKSIVRRKIKDPDVLWLLDEIIDSADGIPIGNYLSQYFGNLYLTYFDHWMKEEKRCRYYFRYCDDIVVLHSNKEILHRLFREVEEYLSVNLRLSIKSDHQVFPVDRRGIDFLGYRFFHDYVLLRKSIAQRFKDKVLHIRRGWRNLKPGQIVNSIMSYWGWMQHGDCLNLARKYIDEEIQQIIIETCKTDGTRNPLRGAKWLKVTPTQKPR